MRSNIFSTVAHLTSTTSLTRPALLAVFAAGAVLAPSPSFALDDGALPTGESVIGGSATFDRSVINVLNVNQNTDRVVINWDSFNIGSQATTEFFQPGTGSLAVNRVLSKGSDPTRILGTLRANGRVMVLDRNGVLFGAGSVIDVGGIVASTGDVRAEDVMSGAAKLVLTNLGETGSVVNEGLVKVSDGGLAAFVAPTVRNSGVITAKLGKVALAAGTETATVDLYGDGLVELAVSKDGAKVLSENSGVIDAESGTVMMTASAAKDVVDTVINMSGVINASSAKMVGGKIILSAGGGKVKVSGKADVSGKGAGSVKVTGDSVDLTETSDVAANGIESGNGGDVYVYGEKSVVFQGAVSAQGGAASGNGGTVEVSTKGDLVFTGGVSTLAANGAAGTLIIDPDVLTIHSGLLNWGFGSINYLSDDLLAVLLAGNGTVTVQASNMVNVGTDLSGGGIGNGTVDVSQNWFFGWWTTLGNLNLKAPTVNFVKDLKMGFGNVSVDAAVLNLNSEVYGKSGSNTVLLGDDRLNSSGALGIINVLSPNAKIQQAVSFANNGANINVGSGTYNESIDVYKSVGLYGLNAVINPNSPGFYITADGVTVDGFEIINADTGIVVEDADHVTLTANNIHNLDSGDGIRATDADYLSVLGNTITGNSMTGSTTGVRVTNSSHVDIGDGQGGGSLRNTISRFGRGVFVLGGHDVEVDNNLIRNTDYGIRANGVDSLVIVDNELDGRYMMSGDGEAGIYVENSYDAQIGGMYDSNKVADYDIGIRVSNSQSADIENNDVSEFDDYGISVSQSDYVDVKNNDVEDGDGTGIRVYRSNYAEINSNEVSDVHGDGIQLVDSDHVDIIGNDVTHVGGNGIYVDPSDYVEIAWNSIRDVHRDGIRLDDGHDGWIHNNSVTDADDDGIDVGNNSGVRIVSNNVRDTHDNGIEVSGSWNADVLDNVINDAHNDGIEVSGSAYADIRNNEVYHSGDDGIDVDGSSWVDVNDNRVHGSRFNGVEVTNSYEADIKGNRVDYTGGDGVYVEDSSHATISGNQIHNTGDDGIDVNGGHGVDVMFNTIWSTDGDGIQSLWSDFVDILWNKVSWASDDGIDVEGGEGVDVKGNTVKFSRNNGIEVTDAQGVDVSWNWVNGSGEDGIHVERGNNVLVSYNNVRDSGYDGISVSDVYGYEMPVLKTVGPSYSFYDAKIIGNFVRDSGNHGIATYDVPRVLITWNNVADSGYFGGYDTLRMDSPTYSRGGDGIHVEVSDADRKGSGDVLVDVIGNWVANSADDGIDVDFTHQGRKGRDDGYEGEPARMAVADVYDGGYEEEPRVKNRVDINILGNMVYNSRDDGIVVSLHGNHEGDGYPEVGRMEAYGTGGGYGHGITEINVLIARNAVNNPVDVYDPEISLYKTELPYFGSRGDGIEVNSYFSPWANVETNTTVRNNFVANSGENGVYFSGPAHDFITMSGNRLVDNPVGAHFESGEIDLTGETNTIVGGNVGLLFRPYLIGYEYSYDYGGDFYDGDYAPKMMTVMPPMTPIYAAMSLVDNTIGNTVFEGQDTYYVELDNGAFFDPGRPTLLNGLDATYDGFSPSSQGGVLTQAQYNYLESMFYHYRDDDSLGLFFFGFVPQAGISQEDIFRIFGGFNPKSPSGGLVITGLPSIGGGAPQAGGAGGNPFANIAPAAGEEEDAPLDPNAIEPAAGGDANDAACWGDAANILGQGSAVSYSFGDEGTKLLDKAASCGNAQQPL